MKPTLPTILGGTIALTGITALQYGSVLLAALMLFLLGITIGYLVVLYPLARHSHLHMYVSKGRVIRESMLIPQRGLRDMTGKQIQPGDIVMMLENGYLLSISKQPSPLNKSAPKASISSEA